MKFTLDSASFVIYSSYFEQFKILKMTDEEIGGVFKALNDFAVTGDAPEMDDYTPAQQAFLCNALQMTLANMKRSTNGKKGGRPTKPEENEAEQKKDAKPKKSATAELKEKEPQNNFDRIEQAYLCEWRKLYEKDQVKTESPRINFSQVRAIEKDVLKSVPMELIIGAIKKASSDDFCLEGGFTLSTILSANVLNRLISGKEKQQGFDSGQSDFGDPMVGF